jgi:YggT family protein
MLIFIHLINLIFQVYTLMLFARILGSWLPQLSEYRIMQFIAYYTDPYLNFFRRFIPPLGMIDFSPIIAFLCLGFIQNIILNLMTGLLR